MKMFPYQLAQTHSGKIYLDRSLFINTDTSIDAAWGSEPM